MTPPPRSLFSDRERDIVGAIARLADGNPFSPERIQDERTVLGDRFTPRSAVWHAEKDISEVDPNLVELGAAVERLVPELRERLENGARASDAELLLYESAVRHLLFQRHIAGWWELIELAERGESTTGAVAGYRAFADDVRHYLHDLPGVAIPVNTDPPHLYAWGFQIRRAFHQTYRQIFGGSQPAAALRAAVWQSIFTHNPQRYRRALFDRMADATTLVTGESGTGKELVARAIALSRYVPFDPKRRCFTADYAQSFFAVNLMALSPTLIESELFGHRRGAFTGALETRAGWLETAGPGGCVFLDEIGELDGSIQVKLLRVLQNRTFQRIGETDERIFSGKIIAATNRDLGTEIRTSRFRRDLYYRLCSDTIVTPTLREQLAEKPDDLHNLLTILARRIVGDAEAAELAEECAHWIERNLPKQYDWPGNVRELEQCVRNVLIRGDYRPHPGRDEAETMGAALRAGSITAERLVERYVAHVYSLTGSYQETARRLELDRRTVKAKVLAAAKRDN